MKKIILISMLAIVLFTTLSMAQTTEGSKTMTPEETILALEKAALDRWQKGDTFGYIGLGAEDITYFDPGLDKRLEGAEAFRKYLAPINGTFTVYRFDLIDPQVRVFGNIGILTYNLNSLGEDGKITSRWNTTEVYQKIEGDWKIIHSHWSNSRPAK